MKQLGFASVVAATALVAHPALADDRSYDVKGFNSLDVSAGIVVIVTGGKDYSVEASSTARGLRMLEIYRRGDTLHIGREKSWSGLALLRTAPEIEVVVTMPDIETITASSGSDVTAQNGFTDMFQGEASSGASLTLAGINSARVVLEASSGASLGASGQCGDLNAEASSGATLRAADLTCQTADAEASSGASIDIFASDTVEAEASSGASIRVDGKPSSVEEDVSSGGAVILKD